MFIKKKTIILFFISILIIFVACIMGVYMINSKPSQVKNSDLYGTYQFDIRNIDNGKYLAVIPPSSGDANESEGRFQLYNIDNEVLAQGTCKLEKDGFITFYVDDKNISTMFFIEEKYYFVDNLLEPQEITKISKEPMVSTPLE